MCLFFWERTQKGDPHKLFFTGILEVKKGVPNGPFSATKSLVYWQVPNPPGANPLVAERAFPTSDYWGRTGVARGAEEIAGICRDFQ